MRKIGLGLALVLLGLAGVTFISFRVGGTNMETYCAGLTPGLPVKEVELSARREGYRFHPGVESESGAAERVALVTSGSTMGRFVCEVRHDGSQVVGARYVVND